MVALGLLLRYIINLAVTPGNNFFFKKVIEIQVFGFLLGRTRGQLQSLREILRSMTEQHLLVSRRHSLPEIRANLEALLAARNPGGQTDPTFTAFFDQLELLRERLKTAKALDQVRCVSTALWSFMEEERAQES